MEKLKNIDFRMETKEEKSELFLAELDIDKNVLFLLKGKYYTAIFHVKDCDESCELFDKGCGEVYLKNKKNNEIYEPCNFTSNYVLLEITDKKEIIKMALSNKVYELEYIKRIG